MSEGREPITASTFAKSATFGELLEGLAYAQRPIFAAARIVKKQYGLGPRGAFILNLVSKGMTYPHELAETLHASRSLITADLGRLVAAELIQTVTDTSDRRATRLHLTAKGHKVCKSIRDEMARIVMRNLSRFGSDDLQLFAAMLSAVRHLEPEEQPKT